MFKKMCFLVAVVFLCTSLFSTSLVVYGEEGFTPVVIAEYDFEDGTQGWVTRGSVTLTSSDLESYSGERSLLTTGRTDNWHGPSLNALSILEKDAVYEINGWVKLTDVPDDSRTIRITIQRDGEGGQDWDTVAQTTVTDTGWALLSGTYSFQQDLTEMILYVESSGETDSFYIDDVTITMTAPPPVKGPVVIANYDFEDGAQGWSPRGSVTLTSTDVEFYSGERSLLTTGRSEDWNGPSLNALDILEKGAAYEISGWVKLADIPDEERTVKITIQRNGASGQGWDTVAQTTVSDTEWTYLSGTYSFLEDLNEITLYIESSGETDSFYIDDITIIMTAPAPEQDKDDEDILFYDFEDGTTQGWSPRGCSISATTEAAYDGDYSLKASDRTDNWNGPSLNVLNLLEKDTQYDISLYVKLAEEPEEAIRVTMSMEENPSEGDTRWNNISSEEVLNTDWVEINGSYTYTENMDELVFYVEANNETVEFYIDNVRIAALRDQSGIVSDFEEDDSYAEKWVPRDADRTTVEITDAANRTSGGSRSLLTTTRTQYEGPLLDVMGKMHRGHEYELSVWVKMAEGQSITPLRITVEAGTSGPWTNVTPDIDVTADEWVELKGTFELTFTPEVLNVYVELPSGYEEDKMFYIDDFTLTHLGTLQGPLPVQRDIGSLREIYAPYFKIGAAVENIHLTMPVGELFELHYNSVVAENAMKPSYMSRGLGEYHFADGKVLADYVRAYNEGKEEHEKMDFRFHTLVWHSQGSDWMLQDGNGNWLESTPENKELVLERLKDYIWAAMEEFGDVLTDIDVVNEVIDANREDGMRDTYWNSITGKDFVEVAFKETRAALDFHHPGNNVRLYINDYNTHNPAKRDALFELATYLRDERNTPIDGVGHQTHINIAGPSIQLISDSIRLFAEAGFDIQITELDVSVYTDNTVYPNDEIPEVILARQGYRYKELFEELVRLNEEGKEQGNPNGWISNVTLWGIADDHTWLHNRGGLTRQDAPFPFDRQHQAKPAYWGMYEAVVDVEESRLPIFIQDGNSGQGTPVLGQNDVLWFTLPALITDSIGSLQGEIRTLWDEDYLYVRVEVADETNTDTDMIEIFVEGDTTPITVMRNDQNVVEVDGGYIWENKIKLDGSYELGSRIKFDVRITDMGIDDGSEFGGNGVIVSWSDPRNAQHIDNKGNGELLFASANKIAYVTKGTPVIDGEKDEIWKDALLYTTDVRVEGTASIASTADFHLLWDDEKLYVYAMVYDRLLSDASADTYQQDSIEIFLDQNNAKTSVYDDDDGQYRVNFNNVQSYNGNASASNFTTATRIIEGVGYVVEAAIDFDHINPEIGTILGFDLQVNNDENGNGTRDTVMIWNDPSGQSWQNVSGLGTLVLVKEVGEPPVTEPPVTEPPATPVPTSPPSGGGGGTIVNPTPTPTPTPSVEIESPVEEVPGVPGDEPAKVELTVDEDGIVNVSEEYIQEALDNKKDGKIAIEVTGIEDEKNVLVKLSVDLVKMISESGIEEIEVIIGIAKIELPVSLFTDFEEDANIELKVSIADADSLTEDVKNIVGTNTVYSFNLSVDGKDLSQLEQNQKVKVSFNYSIETGLNKGQVVLYYIDENGNFEVVKNGRYNNGMIQFKTKYFGNYVAIPAKISLADMDKTPWAKDSIIALAARNIVKGVSADSFDPLKNVTRAEFVQMLVNTFDLVSEGTGENPFTDVESGAWYEQAIITAYELGVVKGNTDGSFGVNDEISRQDMAVMTFNTLKAVGITLTNTTQAIDFADGDQIAGYAKEAVAAMQKAGIISGMPNGDFAPLATANRAQAAVVLYKLLDEL
ncbi:UNVERIFIED_CONTAM: endo-1,4-beta-xylanase [Acetivibrio alkalicellulosi]